MGFIIDFFEYTISGWVFWMWFFLMIIFSLACLGVVGDKVSRKREAEAKARQLAAAEEEYRKAHELIEKQSHNIGLNVELDPTAQSNASQANNSSPTSTTVPDAAPAVNQAPLPPVGQQVTENATPNVQQPAAASTVTAPKTEGVESTPQQTSEPVPNVLVLDEKPSETVNPNNQVASSNESVNPAPAATEPGAKPAVDNTDAESIKTDVPAVLIINDDGTSNT